VQRIGKDSPVSGLHSSPPYTVTLTVNETCSSVSAILIVWRSVQAVSSKQCIFDHAAEQQALVFAHHFPPFPNLGYVIKQTAGWRWQPLGM
jgi:hypothetical protein